MSKYAKGKYALGECARSGRVMPLKDMVKDGYVPNLMVDPAWREPKHPLNKIIKIDDPIALRHPAPQVGGPGVTISWPSYDVDTNTTFFGSVSYIEQGAVVAPVATAYWLDETPPGAEAQYAPEGVVLIEWDAGAPASALTEYQVMRSTDAGPYVPIATFQPDDPLSYLDHNPGPGVHDYMVRAQYIGGGVADSNVEQAVMAIQAGRKAGIIVAVTAASFDIEDYVVGGFMADSQNPGLHTLQRPTSGGAGRLALSLSTCLLSQTGGNTNYFAPAGFTAITAGTVAQNRLAVAYMAVEAAGQIAAGSHSHGTNSHVGAEICVLLNGATYKAAGGYVIVPHATDPLTLTLPGTTAVGDWLMACIFVRSRGVNIPPGWQLAVRAVRALPNTIFSDFQAGSILYKQATAGDISAGSISISGYAFTPGQP